MELPLSCAFEHLYPSPGAFPEAMDAEELAAIGGEREAHGIEFLAELFPACGYGEPFSPAIFLNDPVSTAAMAPLYTSIAMKAVPPCVLVAIDDARTCGSIVATAPPRSRIIYETQRPNDRAATGTLAAARVGDRPTHVFDDQRTDYLFLESPGSSNYGHVLVDDLPRLKAFEVMSARAPANRRVAVMVAHSPAIDRVRREAVRDLGGRGVEVVLVPADSVCRFERLHYASPVSMHPIVKNRHALDFLAAAAGVVPHTPSAARSLLVLRPPGSSRRLTNDAAVLECLAPAGFRSLEGALSFAEQVNAFRQAHAVVGVMGAAMTNTLFCAPGTPLLYLAPEGWHEPFYWDLAVARQQVYAACYGIPAMADTLPHLSDFAVEVGRVESWRRRHAD